jgi:hypothetical protein
MTYQDAKEIGEIIVSIGPYLVIIGAGIGIYLGTRKRR